MADDQDGAPQQSTSVDNADPADAYRQAMMLYAERRYVEADRLLYQAAQGGLPRAAAELGRRLVCQSSDAIAEVFEKIGAESTAQRALRLALDHDPDNSTTAMLLAALLDRQYEAILEHRPWEWDHNWPFWLADLGLGQRSDDLADDDEGDELDEDDPDVLISREWKRDALRRRDQAVRWYRHALRCDPTNAAAANGLLLLLTAEFARRRQGPLHPYDDDIWPCDDDFSSDPDDDPVGEASPASLDAVLPAEDSDLLNEAAQSARHALALNQNNNLAAVELARVLYWQGDHSQARQWFNRALELDPADTEAAKRFIKLQPDPTDLAHAADVCRSAAESGNGAAAQNLARLLDALGKPSEAEHWRRHTTT